MRVVLFDEVLETHTVRSLDRALSERGHEVITTGKVWQGHRFPTTPDEVARIDVALDVALAHQPDVFFNFRASTLVPEQVRRVRAAGARSMVFLPDDPVLYEVCYRHIVDDYDDVLHCGGEHILDFYERRHGRSGVNFPFWTGSDEWPDLWVDPSPAFDLAFLGNCRGQVRSGRYAFLESLPFDVRIFGRVDSDPAGLWGGWCEGEKEVARALSAGGAGINIPQFFEDYAGSDYDFDELGDLGHFQFPSRVIQYARLGLPVASVERDGIPSTFPEMVHGRDHGELVRAISGLLADPDHRRSVARATKARWERSFSARARAAFVESLVLEPDRWSSASASERATAFASLLPAAATANARPTPPRVVRSPGSVVELPVAEQRQRLRRSRPALQSPVQRVVLVGSGSDELSPVAEHLRALQTLGHRVLHIDPSDEPTVDSAQSIVSRFRPTLIATVGDTALHPAIARTGVPVVAAPFGADRHLVATEPRSEPHQPLIVLRLSDHVPTPDEVAHIADRYAAVVRRAAGGAGSNEAPYWGSFFHLRTSSKLHLLVNEGVAVEVEARAALRSAAIGGVPICSPDAAAAVGLRNGVNCMTLDGLGDAIAVIDGLLADRPWVDELSAAALRHVIDQHLLDDRWRTLIADASPSSAPTPTSDAEPVLPVAADLMEALLELAELTPPEEVDAAGRAVDLRQGSIDSSGMGEAPPFVAEIDRDQARFHLSASGPSAGDVVEYRLPIHHGRRDPVRIEVVVRSPYERPQNAGRLRYVVIVDDRRLVSEDIALRSEANLVSFEFRPTKDVSVLRIMVEAKVDCEEWSFGRAGRLEVGPVRYWTGDYALTSTVTASSPEATIYS